MEVILFITFVIASFVFGYDIGASLGYDRGFDEAHQEKESHHIRY